MFEVTESQQQKIKDWLKSTVYPDIINRQKSDPIYQHSPFAAESWGSGYPYDGCSGGSLTYEFTPTSIGVILRVSYFNYDKTLDVTDYENW